MIKEYELEINEKVKPSEIESHYLRPLIRSRIPLEYRKCFGRLRFISRRSRQRERLNATGLSICLSVC